MSKTWSMVPSWSQKHCAGRVLRVMPPLTRVRLRCYDIFSLMALDIDILLYANANLISRTYCSYMNLLSSFIFWFVIVVTFVSMLQ